MTIVLMVVGGGGIASCVLPYTHSPQARLPLGCCLPCVCFPVYSPRTHVHERPNEAHRARLSATAARPPAPSCPTPAAPSCPLLSPPPAPPPQGIAAYDLERLTADVAAVAAALGRSRITLVAHDWGGGDRGGGGGVGGVGGGGGVGVGQCVAV